MSQNKEFDQAWEVWFRAALSQLPSQSPFTDYIELIPYGNDAQIPVPTANYYKYRNEIVGLPEFDVLVDIIANSPELQSILLTDAAGQPILSPESRKYWLGMYCDKFIVEYLGAAREISFKFADYERVYEKLVQFIEQTEPFDALWLIHIRNLTLEIDKVVLEPGIYLRQATSEEKTNAMRYQPSFPDIPNVFLEIHHSIERRSSPQQQEAANIAEAVVLALRLIKANPVGVASFQWRVLDQPFWLFGGYASTKLLLPLTYLGEPYILTQQDAVTLQALWPKAKRAYTDPKLSTAITRLEDAYSRIKLEDKLIDYWTALEALFFSDEEFRDMGKSLALAASYYLGRTESIRKSIYNDLTRSHRLRSHFIHGERNRPNLDLTEMVTKTGNHLRQTLRQRIEE